MSMKGPLTEENSDLFKPFVDPHPLISLILRVVLCFFFCGTALCLFDLGVGYIVNMCG